MNCSHSIRRFQFPTFSDQFVKNPKYIVSALGKFMLTHNGFKFLNTGKATSDMITRWRCSYKENDRYSCKAKAITFVNLDGVEVAEFKGMHQHAQIL